MLFKYDHVPTLAFLKLSSTFHDFTTDNLRIVRPGDGAPPNLYEHLIGKIARRADQAGTPLGLDQLL